MTIGSRIRQLRRQLDLTQQEFADRIGIKRNTIANYEGDRNAPVDSVVSLICREYHANEAWLRTGEGEMFAPAPASALDALVKERGLPRQDGFVIEEYLKLSDATRAEIRKFILNLADNLKAEAAETAQAPADEIDWEKRRAELYAEVDRQIDLEKEKAEKSAVS